MDQENLVKLFKNQNITHFNKKNSDEDLPYFINYCVNKSIKKQSNLFLELGVFTGNTFNMIRSSLPESIPLYGFDTFTGLTEDWMINEKEVLYAKGTFALDYIPHETNNTKFIVGDIHDTLEPFLEKHQQEVSFVHFDMDLYNPTYFALKKLYSRMIKETVLVFDDFYNLPGWQNYSFKAFLDFVNETNLNFEPLCTVGMKDGWSSVSVKIK